MKIDAFLDLSPDRSHISNFILGAHFPPKSGARLNNYELLQSFKPNYRELCSGTLIPNGRSTCAGKPIFLAPASLQDDGSMHKANSLKLLLLLLLLTLLLFSLLLSLLF